MVAGVANVVVAFVACVAMEASMGRRNGVVTNIAVGRQRYRSVGSRI
jgi:hypothetical protein